MGFGGGGGGALTNHVHNSVPLQGGPLDFANDTIASLNAGSTTFSDGAALQELVIGNVGESMVVNGAGTAPEWGSASGGGNYTLAESFTQGGSASTMTCTLASAIAISGISEIVFVFSGTYASGGGGGLELQIRTDQSAPITAGHYSWGVVNLMDATTTTGEDLDHFLIGPSTTAAGSNSSIIAHLIFNPVLPVRLQCSWTMAGLNVINTTGGGGTFDDTSAITDFEGIVLTNSSGTNILADSTVDIYKVTR